MTTAALIGCVALGVPLGAQAQANLTYDYGASDNWIPDTPGAPDTPNDAWLDGGAPAVFTNGDNVVFGDDPGAGTTVLLEENSGDPQGSVRPASITFQEDDVTIDTAVGQPAGFGLAANGTGLLITLDDGISAEIAADIVAGTGADQSITVNGGADAATSVLTLSGDNAASVGTLTLQEGGLVNTGNYGGAISVTGGVFDANGGALAEDVAVSGGTLRIGGATGVSGSTFDPAGSVIVNGTGTAIVNFDTDVDVDVAGDGTLQINASRTLTGDVGMVDGDVDLNGAVTGAITLSGGVLNVSGTGSATEQTVNNGGTINHDGGNGLNGIRNNSGSINVRGNTNVVIDNRGGTVANRLAGTMTSNYTSQSGITENFGAMSGNVTVAGIAGDGITDRLTNSGAIGGTLTVQSGVTVFNRPGASIAGKVTQTGGTFNAEGGTFSATEETLVQGGFFNVVGNSDTDIRNAGATDAATTVTVQSGRTLTGNVANVGGTLVNQGAITGTTTISGGVVTAEAGTFTSGVTQSAGRFEIDPGDSTAAVTKSGGEMSIAVGGRLIGTVTNSGGDVEVNGTLTGALSSSAGQIELAEGTIGGLVNVTGGTFQTRSAATLQQLVTVTNATGDLDAGIFNGGYLNAAGSTTTITGDVSGVMTNSGTLMRLETGASVTGQLIGTAGNTIQIGAVDGDVEGQGGSMSLRGDITGDVENVNAAMTLGGAGIDGSFTQTGGTVVVTANSRADEGLALEGGDLTINADRRLAAAVAQTGGDAFNDGIATLAVTVDGGTWAQNAGSDTLGETVVGTGGTLVADGGAFSGGLTMRGGDLSMTASTSAEITNDGSDIEVPDTLTLDGSLTNLSGTAAVNGTILGPLAASGGTVTVSGTAVVTEAATVSNAGILNLTGGLFQGGVAATGGNLNITGPVSGSVVNNGAVMAISSAGGLQSAPGIEGDLTVTAGSVSNRGAVAGQVQLTGSGRLNNHLTGSIAGATSVADSAVLTASGGSFGAPVTLDGGQMIVAGETAVSVTNTAGQLIIRQDATLTGDVENQADGRIDLAGTLTGDLDNQGEVEALGTHTGDLNNSGSYETALASSVVIGAPDLSFTVTGPANAISGSVTNAATGVFRVEQSDQTVGEIQSAGTVAIADRVLSAATAANFTAGTLEIDSGTLAAPQIDIAEGVVLALTDATLEGNVVTAADMISNGDTRIDNETVGDGDLTLSGTALLAVQSGSFDIAGDLAVGDDAVLDVSSGATLAVAGEMRNTGTANFADGLSLQGAMLNSGRINLQGAVSFADTLSGGGAVSLQVNAAPTDVATINGDLSDQTFLMDVDLSGSVGLADQIVMGPGTRVTGTIGIEVNVLGIGGEQEQDVVLIDVADGDPGNYLIDDVAFNSAIQAANPDQIITYSLRRDETTGDLVIFDTLDQGISSIAGTVVLSQSLIGLIVNRPSSPFVSGLAFEDENPCGAGLWARGIGGAANVTGQVEDVSGNIGGFESSVDTSYFGVQLGGDYACFNGFYNGFDVAFGGIGGVNFGTARQPIFSPNALPGDPALSNTTVDFQQGYAGVYVAAVRDALAVDLQYRLERTNYVATNDIAVGGPDLGLDNEKFAANAFTLSGALSYAIPLAESGITFVPTVGFAYGRVSTDPINFEDVGTVQVDDYDSRVGFIGGTLSRTSIGEDGESALTQFGTLTVYNDFAEAPNSTFNQVGATESRLITTQNLGAYGEVSAGLNYIKILQPGDIGAAKQFSASVRGDLRFSDRLDSYGVTAQARFQF